MTSSLADLLTGADRAAASGDLATAQKLLKQAASASPEDMQLLMKLAAVSKAAGQPREALAAVHQALVLEPLDFVALVLRASLLDALGEVTGEAWSNALARRPGGELPPPAMELMTPAANAAAIIMSVLGRDIDWWLRVQAFSLPLLSATTRKVEL